MAWMTMTIRITMLMRRLTVTIMIMMMMTTCIFFWTFLNCSSYFSASASLAALIFVTFICHFCFYHTILTIFQQWPEKYVLKVCNACFFLAICNFFIFFLIFISLFLQVIYLDVLKVCDPCFCSGRLVGQLLHLLLDRVHGSEKVTETIFFVSSPYILHIYIFYIFFLIRSMVLQIFSLYL